MYIVPRVQCIAHCPLFTIDYEEKMLTTLSTVNYTFNTDDYSICSVKWTVYTTLHSLAFGVPVNYGTWLCCCPSPNCTVYTVYRALYIVHCTLNTVRCLPCTLYCTLYTEHCTLFTVHFILYTLHWTLYTVYRTLYIVHCTLNTVHCLPYTLYYKLYTEHCTLFAIYFYCTL